MWQSALISELLKRGDSRRAQGTLARHSRVRFTIESQTEKRKLKWRSFVAIIFNPARARQVEGTDGRSLSLFPALGCSAGKPRQKGASLAPSNQFRWKIPPSFQTGEA